LYWRNSTTYHCDGILFWRFVSQYERNKQTHLILFLFLNYSNWQSQSHTNLLRIQIVLFLSLSLSLTFVCLILILQQIAKMLSASNFDCL
jgi:hypothetical protein